MLACILMIAFLATFFVLTLGGGITLCYLSSIAMAKSVFHGGCLLFLAVILFIISLLMGVWLIRNWISN